MDNKMFEEEEVLDGDLKPIPRENVEVYKTDEQSDTNKNDSDENTVKRVTEKIFPEQTEFSDAEAWEDEDSDGGYGTSFLGGGSHLQFVLGMLVGVLLVLIFMGMFLARYQMRAQGTNLYGGESEDGIRLNLSSINVKLSQMESLINDYFLNEVEQDKIEENIYDGVMEALEDPYSEYYTQEEVKLLNEATSGEYSGIGASLKQDPETNVVTVVNCFEGSPAMEAGLLAGDVISEINGDKIGEMDLSEVVARIKTDKGKTITLTISRDGEEDFELELERRKIEVPTVTSEMLEHQIGYIQLSEFDTITADQFDEHLNRLQEEGMESLIVDLRDNPGGVLQVVVKILDRILPEGMIVYTEDKNGIREEFTSDEEHKLEIPLVVLINENSASASEIFAGAVKDYGIGTLIGEKTFGKGIVQSIYNLADGTAVKLTVSKYYTPNGNNIHEIGIEPDIELAFDLGEETEYSKEADNQLQKAIEVLSLENEQTETKE